MCAGSALKPQLRVAEPKLPGQSVGLTGCAPWYWPLATAAVVMSKATGKESSRHNVTWKERMPGPEWTRQGSGRCPAPRGPGTSPFPSRFRRKRRPKRRPSRVAAAVGTATYDAQIHDAIHALVGNKYTARTCSTPNRADGGTGPCHYSRPRTGGRRMRPADRRRRRRDTERGERDPYRAGAGPVQPQGAVKEVDPVRGGQVGHPEHAVVHGNVVGRLVVAIVEVDAGVLAVVEAGVLHGEAAGERIRIKRFSGPPAGH